MDLRDDFYGDIFDFLSFFACLQLYSGYKLGKNMLKNLVKLLFSNENCLYSNYIRQQTASRSLVSSTKWYALKDEDKS